MKHLGRIQKAALSVMLLLAAVLQPVQAVFATTSYESDGAAYEEGYIFVGESHINIACTHVYTDAAQTEGGNLFFVFGGLEPNDSNEEAL